MRITNSPSQNANHILHVESSIGLTSSKRSSSVPDRCRETADGDACLSLRGTPELVVEMVMILVVVVVAAAAAAAAAVVVVVVGRGRWSKEKEDYKPNIDIEGICQKHQQWCCSNYRTANLHLLRTHDHAIKAHVRGAGSRRRIFRIPTSSEGGLKDLDCALNSL